MQSVSTRSRARTSSRSWGSKRASQERAAPRSHGAMKTLRADFDHPEAAVHREVVGGGRSVLGLDALAGEVALAVQDRLRLARRRR